MKCNRIIIYAKDIQRITGKTDRYGRALLDRIRKYYKKPDHQFVTIEEFCAYSGLPYQDVVAMLD
jgi:hypothetical protein